MKTKSSYKWGMPQGIGEWVTTLFFALNIYNVLETYARVNSKGRVVFEDISTDLSYVGWAFFIFFINLFLLGMLISLGNPMGNWFSSGSFFLWSAGALIISLSIRQELLDSFIFWLFGYLLVLLGSFGRVFLAFYRPIPPPFMLKEVPEVGNASVWLVDLGKKSGDVLIELARISNWGIGLVHERIKKELPFQLAENISPKDAENLVAALEAKGATLEIRSTLP